MWQEIVEIRLRKDMGLLQCQMESKIEITLKQIGILHQGTGVVDLEKKDLMGDQMIRKYRGYVCQFFQQVLMMVVLKRENLN
jgi:hypothetical protein